MYLFNLINLSTGRDSEPLISIISEIVPVLNGENSDGSMGYLGSQTTKIHRYLMIVFLAKNTQMFRLLGRELDNSIYFTLYKLGRVAEAFKKKGAYGKAIKYDRTKVAMHVYKMIEKKGYVLIKKEQGETLISITKRGEEICASLIPELIAYKKISEQIERNMHEDNSKFGVLVSRTFPKEALSDKAWVLNTREENSVILVKPECFTWLLRRQQLCYSRRQSYKNPKRTAEEMEAVFKALMYWINGEEFQETIKYFDNAVNEANKTKDQMIKAMKTMLLNSADLRLIDSQKNLLSAAKANASWLRVKLAKKHTYWKNKIIVYLPIIFSRA